PDGDVPVFDLALQERKCPHGIRERSATYADAALRNDTERQVTGELQSIPQAYDGRVAGAVDATVQLVPAPCLGLRSDVRADADARDGIVPPGVGTRHKPLAGLQRHRGRDAIRSAEAPDFRREVRPGEAERTAHLAPELQLRRRTPPRLQLRHRCLTRGRTGTADHVVREPRVHLQVGPDVLHHADTAVLAFHALQLEILPGVLEAQFRGTQLQAALQAHFRQAGLHRHVGRIGELAA